MSAFVTDLLMRDNNDGVTCTLTGDLRYQSDLLHGLLIVPTGFITDFASIPKGLWNILPKFGAYNRAAVVHDYLYTVGSVTRAQADAVLNEAMTVCKIPDWRRRLIYLGVLVGGWKAWGEHRADDRMRA